MLSNSPSKEELTPKRQSSPIPQETPTTPEANNDDAKPTAASESEDKQTPAETPQPQPHPQPAASKDQETPQPLLLSGPGATKFGRGKRVPKPRDFFDPTAFAGSVQKKQKKNPTAAAAPTPVQNNKNSLKRKLHSSTTDRPDRYEVNALIGVRQRRDERQWLVEWFGYSDTQATWKSEKELEKDLGAAGFREYRHEWLRELVETEMEEVERRRRRDQVIEVFDGVVVESAGGFVEVLV